MRCIPQKRNTSAITMVDVPRIPGTQSPADQPGKDKAKVDAEKFKKMMEVEKTDPELQKKRKRKEEAEEEKKAKAGAAPKEGPPPANVRKEQEPLRIPRGNAGADQTRSKIPSAPIPKERMPPGFEKLHQPPKIERVGHSEKGEKQRQKRPEEAPPEAEEGIAPTPAQKAAAAAEALEIDKADAEKAEQTASFIQMDEIIEETLTPHETPFEQAPPPLPPPAPGPKKEQAALSTVAPTPPPAPSAPMPLFLPAASEVPSPSAFLRPEILEMFEKMVGVLSVMHAQGLSETTIHLDSPAFQNSIFAGAKITIREYSTAPKAFNIEFQGNPQNTALFQGSVSDLMAAFQNGNYNFKINRIDTSLQASERPMFHRKEAPGEKEMGGGEGELR